MVVVVVMLVLGVPLVNLPQLLEALFHLLYLVPQEHLLLML
jgi:hypothetical protein